MLHITIICLGKLKESYWREAEAEYLKRLQAFAKVEIMELKEESFDEKDGPETIKEKEARKIKDALNKAPKGYIVILDETGKSFSSNKLAEKVSTLENQGVSNITFVIGGPLGLTDEIRKKANLLLSLSSFTFTHQMARVFLIEQLYRTFMINAGKKYHY
ncbi:MAG TPA: 23S rRNA (pseudouridine(1915)-N(3))-methyltransferase RlmH [Patescibacteria group bacterium]|nr:23S rRNA (pseudouridine(1915)-N(3))-methyltransferase RlmH [Patescibacteria group bacterium]